MVSFCSFYAGECLTYESLYSSAYVDTVAWEEYLRDVVATDDRYTIDRIVCPLGRERNIKNRGSIHI